MTYISAVPIHEVEAILAANEVARNGLAKVVVMDTYEPDTPGDYVTVYGTVLLVARPPQEPSN